jgi:hypothetical protein
MTESENAICNAITLYTTPEGSEKIKKKYFFHFENFFIVFLIFLSLFLGKRFIVANNDSFARNFDLQTIKVTKINIYFF